MIMKRQNVFVKPKVFSPVIRFKVRHEWWDAGNSTESRGIKTTFDREWSECGRGPGVISLWLETHPDKINQNQQQWAVTGGYGGYCRVWHWCRVLWCLLWSVMTHLAAIVSVLTLFICFSPPHRGLAPGWRECTSVPLPLRKAHNCGSG